jgi:hypothetical protein
VNNSFRNQKSVYGFSLKLWRGERMVLLGMDVDDPRMTSSVLPSKYKAQAAVGSSSFEIALPSNTQNRRLNPSMVHEIFRQRMRRFKNFAGFIFHIIRKRDHIRIG